MPNHITTIIEPIEIRQRESLLIKKIKKEMDVDIIEGEKTNREKHPEVFDFNQLLPMPQGIIETKGQAVGHPAWYDWRVENWGTKWNAYDVEYSPYDNDNEKNEEFVGIGYIKFNTAWSCPKPIIEILSKRYPKITFEVKYADEDLGYNLGQYWIKNGEIIDETYFINGTDEAELFARRVRDYS